MTTVSIYMPTGEIFAEYNHIKQINYNNHVEDIVVYEEDLTNHHFPIGVDLTLFSDTATYSVSHELIGAIEVVSEE